MQSFASCGASILVAGLTAMAAGANDTMLVTTEDLASRMGKEPLVILHVGSPKDYSAGHISGARLITLADISITGERGLRLELPLLEALTTKLGALGIDENTRVIIYPGTDSPQSATRVWFTFDYLGLGEHASLLDGGLALWKGEGRPLSTETPEWEARTLRARARPELVVDHHFIHSQLRDKSVRTVDARAPEFYSGESTGSMPRGGRIPGAVNVPYTSFFEPNRKLKNRDQLAALLASPAGSTTVTYCHIGQQATVPYFVARYLGMKARLYDGSFQDWSTREELPVETGAAK